MLDVKFMYKNIFILKTTEFKGRKCINIIPSSGFEVQCHVRDNPVAKVVLMLIHEDI